MDAMRPSIRPSSRDSRSCPVPDPHQPAMPGMRHAQKGWLMKADYVIAENDPEGGSIRVPTDRQVTGRFLVRTTGTLTVVAAVFIPTMLIPGPVWSLQTIGTISLFGLGPLLVVTVWWPRRTASGARTLPLIATASVITLALIAVAVVSVGVALAVVGRFDLAGLFSDAGAQANGIVTPFPFVFPLGALVFVLMLHITFVQEKWPFDTARPIRDGLVAFGSCWVLAVAVYFVVANWNGVDASVLQVLGVTNPGGPIDALDLVGWLAWIGCLDVVVMVLLRGWPFSGIRSRGLRIAVTSTSIPVAGTIPYVLAGRVLDMSSTEIAAVAAMAITAVFVLTIGFDDRLLRRVRSASVERVLSLAAMCVLAGLLYIGLIWVAERFESWTDVPPELWVAISGLNILAPTLILYDSVWERWPFPSSGDAVAPN
jgi:hypothetical protein